jgi:hypothetical protein
VHADRAFGAVVCALSLALLLLGVAAIRNHGLSGPGAEFVKVGPRRFA